MAKKRGPQEDELVSALLTARNREKEELFARIKQALAISARPVPGGLFTWVSDRETEAFFKDPENIKKLARLCIENYDVCFSPEWLTFFSKWCKSPYWEIALCMAVSDANHAQYKREQSELMRNRGEKANQKYAENRQFCLEKAAELWQKDPDCHIGDIVKALQDDLRKKGRSGNDRVIRGWINKAHKAGKFTKPANASNPGRHAK